MGDKRNSEWKRGDPIRYIRDEIPEFDLPPYEGERYEALVPDTLDLQERAALAINGLTGPTDPEADYEVYWLVFFAHNPAMMYHDWCDFSSVQPEFMEALPLMRLVSGSKQNERVERRWMEVLLHMEGPDGVIYVPTVGRPWARINDMFGSADTDHFANPYYIGPLWSAMALYHLRDGSGIWEKTLKRVVDGLTARAIERDGYAYFPLVLAPGQPTNPKEEMPTGLHASLVGWLIQGLAKVYRVLGYEPALELAGKLCRYLKDHGQYHAADGSFLPDSPGGDPKAHFVHHLVGVVGMLEYGMLSGDREMVEYAHKGFQYGMKHGDTLIGYFPENIDTPQFEHSEICEVAYMIMLALKLTEAGVGDYWDEADRWTRNMLAEGQLTRTDWIERIPGAGLKWEQQRDIPRSVIDETYQTTERVAERNLGAFAGWPTANDWYVGAGPGIMHCCTYRGSRVIYFLWDRMLQHDNGQLRVNLLLNRASPWADVDSHIPYVGQVDVRVKQPVELWLRIPEWVQPAEAQVQVNGAARPINWQGRYAGVGAVKPHDVATLTFPISERVDTVYIEKERYTLIRKGNDVVAIDPPGQYCPLYQRAHYRVNSTRWRKIERFVSNEQIDLWSKWT